MSTAQETVIFTPELLEQILARLPMRALLVTTPLVSKTWQAITLTTAFQRALFFQADPASSKYEPRRNPLLVELFPPFFRHELDPENRWGWPGAGAIKAMPWSHAPEAFRRPEASWRRMLVQQPPAQTMLVTETCHGQFGDSQRRATLHDLELRMGMLYDLTVPYIDRVASSFCIHWHNHLVATKPRSKDLTLNVIYTMQCMELPQELDETYYTEGTEAIEINFGD